MIVGLLLVGVVTYTIIITPNSDTTIAGATSTNCDSNNNWLRWDGKCVDSKTNAWYCFDVGEAMKIESNRLPSREYSGHTGFGCSTTNSWNRVEDGIQICKNGLCNVGDPFLGSNTGDCVQNPDVASPLGFSSCTYQGIDLFINSEGDYFSKTLSTSDTQQIEYMIYERCKIGNTWVAGDLLEDGYIDTHASKHLQTTESMYLYIRNYECEPSKVCQFINGPCSQDTDCCDSEIPEISCSQSKCSWDAEDNPEGKYCSNQGGIISDKSFFSCTKEIKSKEIASGEVCSIISPCSNAMCCVGKLTQTVFDKDKCGWWIKIPEFDILGKTYGGWGILPDLWCNLNLWLAKFKIIFSVVAGLFAGLIGASYLGKFTPKMKKKWIILLIGFIGIGVGVGLLAYFYFWSIVLALILLGGVRVFIK